MKRIYYNAGTREVYIDESVGRTTTFKVPQKGDGRMSKKLTELIDQIKGNNEGIKKYAMESLKQFRHDERVINGNPALTAQSRAEAKAKLQKGYIEQHVRNIGKFMADNGNVRKQIAEVASGKLGELYASELEDSPETLIFKRKLETLKFDILTAPDKASALGAVSGLRQQYKDPAYLLSIQTTLREITPELTSDRDALIKARQVDGAITRDISQGDEEVAIASEVIDNIEGLRDEITAEDRRSMSAFAALKPTMSSDDIREFGKDPSLFVTEYKKLNEEEPTKGTATEEQ